MLRKTVLFAPLVAAAAGLPALSEKFGAFGDKSEENEISSGEFAGKSDYSAFAEAPPIWTATKAVVAATPKQRTSPALTPMPIEQVFRLDVGPDWVSKNFPRVSPTLADPQMPGMRVPLVTGERTDDLTGSLSIFFDGQRQAQRLQFHGYTGDPSRLVKFLSQTYRMRAYPSMGQGLYLTQWNGTPTSALHIGFAPATIANHHSLRRYEVRLELNRPAAYFQLSAEFQALVDLERTRAAMGGGAR